jgi:hypothetical protein
MVKLLFAIGALCCFIAVSAAAAQQAGVLDQARQGAKLAQGATLRSIRTFPAKLVSTFDRTQTWLRADQRPSRRPASGSNVSWRRTAGRSRSLLRRRKSTTATTCCRSARETIQPGYIANAISHAGPRKTIVFAKGGIYNFSSAGKIDPISMDDFARLLASESERWKAIVQATGFTPIVLKG